jgi:drug/metabolite transporter (DMT)-like permease
MIFESANWSKVFTPSSLRWTLIAGTLSCVSVFAALRSYDYIPQWLTQAFIGLEPLFGTVGLFIVAQVVTNEKTKKGLLEKLPASWWLFFGGLLLVVIGVVMMALSNANSGNSSQTK